MFTENTSLIWWQRPRSRLGYDRSLLYRVEYFSEWHEVQSQRNAAVVLRQVVHVIVYTVVTLSVVRQERHLTCKKISFQNSPSMLVVVLLEVSHCRVPAGTTAACFISCPSKTQNSLTFWYQLTKVVPEYRPLSKGCYVVCCWFLFLDEPVTQCLYGRAVSQRDWIL